MRSKRVAWSTFTKSASQLLSSSSADRSSVLGASTCLLQYSITFAKILLVTLGNGIPLSAQSSSIICLIVCDSNATASSTSNDSPSELLRVIFLPEDDIFATDFSKKIRERELNNQGVFFLIDNQLGIFIEGGWEVVLGLGSVILWNGCDWRRGVKLMFWILIEPLHCRNVSTIEKVFSRF